MVLQRASRVPRRDERGVTTAEYVGILVLVTLLVVGVIGFATPVGAKAGAAVNEAFCKIGSSVGLTSGCGAEMTPTYVPTECTISSSETSAGASITIIATAAGDSGYTLAEIRKRRPDGTVVTTYQVTTKGKVGADYEFKAGGGVEVDTGKGPGVDAQAGIPIKVGADAAWGSTYSMDNLADAEAFIDQYEDNFGEFGSRPDGAPEPDSTYIDLSGSASVSGELGPAELSAGGSQTIGVQSYANGDTKVKMALSADAAAELGIPLPEQVLKLSAEGKVELGVVADVTFDKDGNVVKIGGSATFTPTGETNVGLNTDLVDDLPIGEDGTLSGVTLPNIPALEAGKSYEVEFSTDFRRPDGTLDYSAATALGEGLANYVANGTPLTAEQQAAIRDQLENGSQITFNDWDYSSDETKYGASGSFLWVKLGGEYHEIQTDKDLQDSYYYDPVAGTWNDNLVCSE